MTHQNYLDGFALYAKEVYDNNIPASSEGTQGGILAMKSYFDDLTSKIAIINDKLTNEANRILQESSNDASIDADKMKEDLSDIVHAAHNEWMESHKPKKRP